MKTTLLLFNTLLCMLLSAQNPDFGRAFSVLLEKGDTTAQRELLADWQQQKPADPEYFVARYNYFVNKSKQEIIRIQDKPTSNLHMEMRDSSNMRTVAFLESHIAFLGQNLDSAFQVISQAIHTFPDRLDMRFGKIYLLGEISEFDLFTREIKNTVAYSVQNGNHWLWSGNKEVENPERFMLGSIQDYILKLYNHADNQSDRMQDIAIEVLKYYPKHIESLSNLAISFMMHSQWDSAIVYLKKAEVIAPKDYVILGNIAYIYKQKGDKGAAKEYYRKMADNSEGPVREDALSRIKELESE